jgi:hypothetical protein
VQDVLAIAVSAEYFCMLLASAFQEQLRCMNEKALRNDAISGEPIAYYAGRNEESYFITFVIVCLVLTGQAYSCL